MYADDTIAEMVGALGVPAAGALVGALDPAGRLLRGGRHVEGRNPARADVPDRRSLAERLWGMGRGKTRETCDWDVEGGEVRALGELFEGVMRFKPAER